MQQTRFPFSLCPFPVWWLSKASGAVKCFKKGKTFISFLLMHSGLNRVVLSFGFCFPKGQIYGPSCLAVYFSARQKLSCQQIFPAELRIFQVTIGRLCCVPHYFPAEFVNSCRCKGLFYLCLWFLDKNVSNISDHMFCKVTMFFFFKCYIWNHQPSKKFVSDMK